MRGVGPTVSAVEVRDLFASVGAVDRVTSSLGANTSSTTYEVAFRTPSKARAAVAEFDGRALTGGRCAWRSRAGRRRRLRRAWWWTSPPGRRAPRGRASPWSSTWAARDEKRNTKPRLGNRRNPKKPRRPASASKNRIDQGAAGRLIQARYGDRCLSRRRRRPSSGGALGLVFAEPTDQKRSAAILSIRGPGVSRERLGSVRTCAGASIGRCISFRAQLQWAKAQVPKVLDPAILESPKNRRMRRRGPPDLRPIPEGVREPICIRKK